MFECSSLALYERFERKQGLPSLLYSKCSTSSCRYIQQIAYTIRSSVGHGYAGIQKFNTLMNILKQMTVKNITKKFKKKIDTVNVVGIIVYKRYWDNKIKVCQALSKTSGKPVLLVWREYKYTFIVLHSINPRFEVSIQGVVFGIPINYHTLIAINYCFKSTCLNSKKWPHLYCNQLPLQSTCLNSQYVFIFF